MTENEREMLSDIEAESGKLSSWEEEFVDSISRKQGELTPRQQDVLVKIHEKVTSGGRPRW